MRSAANAVIPSKRLAALGRGKKFCPNHTASPVGHQYRPRARAARVLRARARIISHFADGSRANRSCGNPRQEIAIDRGGVIQINYEKSFLDQAYNDANESAVGGVVAQMEEIVKSCGEDSECAGRAMSRRERLLTEQGTLPHVSWERIIEHIDHVVRLAGPDHVGLGSDFDGANMPDGLEDCSKLPKITEALLRKGYSEDDIRKILGGNLLRVMELAEKVSRTPGVGDQPR